MKQPIDARVLNCLRKHGARTSEQIMETVGITRAQVSNAMSKLGIKQVRGVYSVAPDKATLGIVPPRSFNVFASPGLSSKYQISALGTREGSNDHLQIRSRHV